MSHLADFPDRLLGTEVSAILMDGLP